MADRNIFGGKLTLDKIRDKVNSIGTRLEAQNKRMADWQNITEEDLGMVMGGLPFGGGWIKNVPKGRFYTGNVKVGMDSSKREVEELMKLASSNGELRGYVTKEGNSRFWDSNDMIHEWMMEKLGDIPAKIPIQDRFFISPGRAEMGKLDFIMNEIRNRQAGLPPLEIDKEFMKMRLNRKVQ